MNARLREVARARKRSRRTAESATYSRGCTRSAWLRLGQLVNSFQVGGHRVLRVDAVDAREVSQKALQINAGGEGSEIFRFDGDHGAGGNLGDAGDLVDGETALLANLLPGLAGVLVVGRQ